jgi:hypothetical protein
MASRRLFRPARPESLLRVTPSARTIVDGNRWGDLSSSMGADRGDGEGDIVRNAHSAVDLGDLNCLEQLVAKDKSIISSVYGVEGWTLLHRACHRGFLDIVKYLLENGADAMIKDAKGWSMLHCALMSRSKATLEILMLFLQRPNIPHQVCSFLDILSYKILIYLY